MGYLAQFGQQLAARDGGWYCHYCHLPLVDDTPRNQQIWRSLGHGIATVDHKTPSAKGGGDCLSNMVLACRRCNEEKGHMSYQRYRLKTFNRRLKRKKPEKQYANAT